MRTATIDSDPEDSDNGSDDDDNDDTNSDSEEEVISTAVSDTTKGKKNKRVRKSPFDSINKILI